MRYMEEWKVWIARTFLTLQFRKEFLKCFNKSSSLHAATFVCCLSYKVVIKGLYWIWDISYDQRSKKMAPAAPPCVLIFGFYTFYLRFLPFIVQFCPFLLILHDFGYFLHIFCMLFFQEICVCYFVSFFHLSVWLEILV